MALRVVAGSAGGRRLVAPKSGARPTTDRVKEALFASLGERVVDAVVLDLYAGSGALGIEALSRGATRAMFVDRDRRAEQAIRSNLATTGFTERASVIASAASAFLRKAPDQPFDLVFLDPPYDIDTAALSEVLGAVAEPGMLTKEAVVVIETGRHMPPTVPQGWTVTWQRAYGDTLLTVATVSTV
jgi:16S rRNA (guanine966-N2)-methyltransferase